MSRRTLYVSTALMNVAVAMTCLFLSYAMGRGWIYVVSTLAAALVTTFGILVSKRQPTLAAKLSGTGAAMCTLVLLSWLVELIHAIPFREQPEQETMLIGPVALLVFSILHLTIAILNSRRSENINP